MKILKQIFCFTMLACLAVSLFSCTKSNNTTPIIASADDFIRAADVSYLPLIESEGTIFKNNNIAENALTTLKNAGCNTIRIRVWKDPLDAHSGIAEVKALALRARNLNMKVWLSVHYSDSWADPANQTKPVVWQNLSFADLKIAVANYTSAVLTAIQPDIYQIGNEVNDGLLWPEGKLSTNETQFLQLVQTASTTIRNQSPTTKIMFHYAGIWGSDIFFDKVKNVSYDYIGLSYYPIWHGKSLSSLQTTMNMLGDLYNKKVIIAETAYPFTLNSNDYTNNILGLSSQIIPDYSATNKGQKDYLSALKTIIKQSSKGIGFCYWEPDWVAFCGPTSTNGSPWENQALWDFNNNSLPAMAIFSPN